MESKLKSKLMRIDMDLAIEIENLAKKNKLHITTASKKIAEIVRTKKGNKQIFEIKF